MMCTPVQFPSMNTDNFIDSLSVMIEQESSKHYSCSDYLSRNEKVESGEQIQKITSDDRMMLVDWCYQIIDNWKLDRETVAIAMKIADRFMCTPDANDILHRRGMYQLVIMTSLYISIKIHEPFKLGVYPFSLQNNTIWGLHT